MGWLPLMRTEDFLSDVAPGRLVPIDGNLLAFVPDALPPKWDMPIAELWPLLRDAWATVKELNGIGRVLPNPTILLKPLEDREAIQSSRIEGTFATARELLLFDKSPHEIPSTDDRANEWREVWNYRQALLHGVTTPLPISKRLIRELHTVLLTNVRGQEKNPGEFRRVQVGIRGTRDDPAFVPPPHELVEPSLNDLETYIQRSSRTFDPLVDCFLVHYQFETIHPFRDGNGRVGRLLLALMIREACGLSHPWLFVSQYFEKHKERYFDLLFQVSTAGTWTDWVRFCLEGTVEQAKDTLERCQRLLAVKDALAEKLKEVRGSNKLIPIIDLILEKMFVTVADVRDRYLLTYPTANSYLQKLVTLKILRPIPGQSPKMFYSPEIYDITYADLGAVE